MKIRYYIIAGVLMLVIWIENAHAYIDPGAGSMALQVLLAALLGAGIFIKQCRIAAVSFLRRVKKKITGQNGDE